MRITVLTAVLVAAVFAAGAALAVPKGKNGPIYFENFSETTSSSDIWSISPAGTGLKVVVGTSAEEIDPSVSPDGKRLAYVSDASGAPFVWVANSDGSGSHKIGSSGTQQSSPAWSPDGKRIAFARCNTQDPDTGECTASQIVLMNVDGGGLKPLTAAGTNLDDRPAWSPNGKTIAFQRMNADGDISLLSIAAAGGSAKKIFADGTTIDLSPSYSPTGKKIAFSSDSSSKEAIYTVNFNGHSPKRLVTELPAPDDPSLGGGAENPAYAPHGDRIVYTANGDLWTVSVAGKGAKQLTQGGGDDADWARG
jgi:TolB protein